jgi:hypothetical protein
MSQRLTEDFTLGQHDVPADVPNVPSVMSHIEERGAQASAHLAGCGDRTIAVLLIAASIAYDAARKPCA